MAKAKFISYEATNSFSDIVIDYISNVPGIRPFFSDLPDVDGIRSAIEKRLKFKTDRQLLVTGLEKQYVTTDAIPQVSANLELLLNERTFTITTAHQPNIFTGPLYFIYKILHAISVADHLNREIAEYNFVPMFYMGSEDADIDELGITRIDGKEYRWITRQKGAVGRMLVDDALLQLINEMQGQLGVLPHGNEILHHLRNCYSKGKTIEQATFEFIHLLFGKYGLVVLLPDNPGFKSVFLSIAEKELNEGFSFEMTSGAINELSKNYKVQAKGREINLFYLEGDSRQRIVKTGPQFLLQESGTELSQGELLSRFNSHPDRVSPNVILRPLFQAMLLPDVVFVGGGGEIAYWLELKAMFEKAGVPYPVLALRNSFLLLNNRNTERLEKLHLEVEQLFMDEEKLFREIVVDTSENMLSLDNVITDVKNSYSEALRLAKAVDPTLSGHVESLEKRAVDGLKKLEKKILRAEKRKFEDERRQLHEVRSSLFPGGGLQERSESILGWYARYGASILEILYSNSKALEHKFGIISLD